MGRTRLRIAYGFPDIDENPDSVSNGAALVGFVIGIYFPVLKGITCAFVVAILCYFITNGELKRVLGKVEGSADAIGLINSSDTALKNTSTQMIRLYPYIKEKV